MSPVQSAPMIDTRQRCLRGTGDAPAASLTGTAPFTQPPPWARRAVDKQKKNPKCPLPTWLLKHQHGLRGGVDRQRARPLHRAVAPAGHAVAAPGVGKPEVLREANRKGVRDVKRMYLHPPPLGLISPHPASGFAPPLLPAPFSAPSQVEANKLLSLAWLELKKEKLKGIRTS